MEFSKLATVDRHEHGAGCKILDPAGNETDVVIRVKGADCAAWRGHKNRQAIAMISAKSEEEINFEQMNIDALVAVTVDWTGIVESKKPYEYSEENARALYTKAPDVVRQLLEFLGKDENFPGG